MLRPVVPASQAQTTTPSVTHETPAPVGRMVTAGIRRLMAAQRRTITAGRSAAITKPPSHAGHGGHGDHVAQFRRLFWWSLVLAVPVVALSPMFAMVVGYSVPTEGVIAWLPAVLGAVLYTWGGWPFLSGAAGELRERRPGMMTLIALAITVAFVASWGAALGLLAHTLEFGGSSPC